MWYNGIECDTDEKYEGDGSEPLNIGMKHLKLSDNCVLVDWDVSLLYNLESIEIGNDCFGSVKTFKIDGLNRLKTIKIGTRSFNSLQYSRQNDYREFAVVNCQSLESIEIEEYSFSGYGDKFEVKHLPMLQSIRIGSFRHQSSNFGYSPFVLEGIDKV